MKTFEDRMHGLPAELFNEIYRLTFTASRHPVVIWKAYKPPSSLQVNRSTRATFAASYYGNRQLFIGNPKALRRWLVPFAANNFTEIRFVKIYVHIPPIPLDMNDPVDTFVKVYRLTNDVYKQTCESALKPDNFFVPVSFGQVSYARHVDIAGMLKHQVPRASHANHIADLPWNNGLALSYDEISAIHDWHTNRSRAQNSGYLLAWKKAMKWLRNR